MVYNVKSQAARAGVKQPQQVLPKIPQALKEQPQTMCVCQEVLRGEFYNDRFDYYDYLEIPDDGSVRCINPKKSESNLIQLHSFNQ